MQLPACLPVLPVMLPVTELLCSKAPKESTFLSATIFIDRVSFILYPYVLGGAKLQIDQNDHSLPTNLGLLFQLTPPRTSDTAVRIRGHRQRRRRRRYLTPLQRTTDPGWTEPPGTPDGNVTWYTLPWARLAAILPGWTSLARGFHIRGAR